MKRVDLLDPQSFPPVKRLHSYLPRLRQQMQDWGKAPLADRLEKT